MTLQLSPDSLNSDLYAIYARNRLFGPHYTAKHTDKGRGSIVRELPRAFGPNTCLLQIGERMYVARYNLSLTKRLGREDVRALCTESVLCSEHIHPPVPAEPEPEPAKAPRVKISRALDNGRDVVVESGHLIVCGVELDQDVSPGSQVAIDRRARERRYSDHRVWRSDMGICRC